MKLLFVSPIPIRKEDYMFSKVGGIEAQIWMMANALSKMGIEVYITTVWNGKQKQISKFDKNLYFLEIPMKINIISDLRTPLLGMLSLFTRLVYSAKVSRVTKFINPDVILITERISGFFIRRKNINTIFVYVVHIPPVSYLHSKRVLTGVKYFFSRILVGSIEQVIINRSNVIVTLNRDMRKYLRSVTGDNSVFFVPNIIECNVSSTQETGKYKWIIYGGRLVPEKGVIELVKAYTQLPTEHKELYNLVIIGKGTLERHLKKILEKINPNNKKTYHFIQWLPRDMFIRMLRKASIFVLPSTFECMPVTVLEAICNGTIVVGTDIPGINDVIINHHNGVLIPANSSEKKVELLKTTLIELLCNLKLQKRLRVRAYKTHNFYKPEKIASTYLKIILTLNRGGP